MGTTVVMVSGGGGPPNFVGVGAQRSGTSWWFSLLTEHPQVFAETKELHYFDRFCTEPFGRREIAGYHALFPLRESHITGEWTPRYMHDFWTPGLLAKAAPKTRLLVLLRDPVERFRSALRLGLTANERRHQRLAFIADAIARGRYWLQLSRLLDYFPREQLLVIQYERCIAEPLACYGRTLTFLGLPSFDPGEALTHGTGGRAQPFALPEHMVENAVAELREDVERLNAEFSEIDVAMWANFRAVAQHPDIF